MENEQEKSFQKVFLNPKEAAEYLGLRPNTLAKMRVYGTGPDYRKHGRCVKYHLSDLNLWSESRKKSSTSDE